MHSLVYFLYTVVIEGAVGAHQMIRQACKSSRLNHQCKRYATPGKPLEIWLAIAKKSTYRLYDTKVECGMEYPHKIGVNVHNY